MSSKDRADKAREIHDSLMRAATHVCGRHGLKVPPRGGHDDVERLIAALAHKACPSHILVDASKTGPVQLLIATSWQGYHVYAEEVVDVINHDETSSVAEMRGHELVITYSEAIDAEVTV